MICPTHLIHRWQREYLSTMGESTHMKNNNAKCLHNTKSPRSETSLFKSVGITAHCIQINSNYLNLVLQWTSSNVIYYCSIYYLVRKDNDGNEHERLSDVTLGYSVKFKKKRFYFAVLHCLVSKL
jgi:hypothetical protein